MIRTRFTYDPSMEIPEKRLAHIAAGQRKTFEARLTDLARLAFDYSWGGRLCLSWNHVPAFGEVEEGLYSGCCENGLGTVKSTLAGLMAADLATGTRSDRLDKYQDQPPPSRLPPEPFAGIGARAVIWLQEFRAGREG